jgi:hypothetical protein
MRAIGPCSGQWGSAKTRDQATIQHAARRPFVSASHNIADIPPMMYSTIDYDVVLYVKLVDSRPTLGKAVYLSSI